MEKMKDEIAEKLARKERLQVKLKGLEIEYKKLSRQIDDLQEEQFRVGCQSQHLMDDIQQLAEWIDQKRDEQNIRAGNY